MNKRYLISIILFLLILFAALTNPTKNDYVSFVKEELINNDQQFAAMFGGPFIDVATTKQNYGLFTVYETQYNKKDETKVKAVGFFNQFFWIKKD